MKVLLISSGEQPAIKGLCTKLNDYYPNDSFEHLNYYSKNPYPIFAKIPLLRYIYRLLIFMSFKTKIRQSDVINIHYIDSYTEPLIRLIRYVKRHIMIVVSVWGSDYFIIQNKAVSYRRKAFALSDLITFANTSYISDFAARYDNKYDHKVRQVRFGLKQLELIKDILSNTSKDELKNKKQISAKYCILAGTNAQENQQHELMIEQLNMLPDEVKRQVCFIFPLTYGNNKERVVNLLKESNINYLIYDNWLTDQEIAELRIICDIIIQLQTNDQFSGAMQEALYAGNQVITGAWLDYSDFIQRGIDIHYISDFPALVDQISAVLALIELKEVNKNPDRVWELSSWEKNIIAWYEIYKEYV